MADTILYQKQGEGTRITINRADCGGLISNPMAAELTGMIGRAAAESKYIVLSSAGADFCLGRDLEGNKGGKPTDALDYRKRSEGVFGLYGAFRRAEVPVVCAVQGRALGLGCAVTAVCDITVAAASATFALPEMAHNIMPTIAMSSLIDRVGRKGALYLAYSTEEIDAETALAYGLVSRVVPDGRLDAQIEQLCAALDRAPRVAVMAVKEYLTHALNMSVEQASDFARNMHGAVNSSAAMRGT
ncbi:MAG: enoyl-CoA hydratase/isomerase family protein [Rhodospirillales bacterium]